MMIMSELVGKKVVVCMWDGRVGLDREGNFWIPDFIGRAGVARIGATRRGWNASIAGRRHGRGVMTAVTRSEQFNFHSGADS